MPAEDGRSSSGSAISLERMKVREIPICRPPLGRRTLLKRRRALGAAVAIAIASSSGGAFAVDNVWTGAVDNNYNNPGNWRSHYDTTAPEIIEQTGGRLTHFVAGLGTSGTLMGTGRFLKEQNPEIKVIAIEPPLGERVEVAPPPVGGAAQAVEEDDRRAAAAARLPEGVRRQLDTPSIGLRDHRRMRECSTIRQRS